MSQTPADTTSSLIIPFEFLDVDCYQEFCTALHFARVNQRRNIFSCAAAVGMSYQELDALERGEYKYFDITIFCRLLKLYKQKIILSLEE